MAWPIPIGIQWRRTTPVFVGHTSVESEKRIMLSDETSAHTCITCLGDSLIDFLPIQQDGHTTGFRMAPGGAMLNVAVGVARLGAPVAYAGALGNDFFAETLHEYIAANGIDQRFIVRAPAQTTLAFTAIQRNEPTFAFYGQATADTLLTSDDLASAFFAETAILHTGSTSLLRGTTPTAITTAMQRLHGHALLSLDPNIRPSLVQDEAAFRDLFATLVGLTDLLKLSAADLAWLSPGEEEEHCVAGLLAQGPEVVIVTHGHEGVVAHTRGGTHIVQPALPVDVADTVGAGDAFSAGFLTGLYERAITSRAALAACPPAMLSALCLRASAVAALNCTRVGADPPYRAEVDARYPQARSAPSISTTGAEASQEH